MIKNAAGSGGFFNAKAPGRQRRSENWRTASRHHTACLAEVGRRRMATWR